MFGDSENSFIDSCYSQMSTQTVFTVLHDFAAVRKQQIETIYSIFWEGASVYFRISLLIYFLSVVETKQFFLFSVVFLFFVSVNLSDM